MGGLFTNWLTQQVPLLLPYYIFMALGGQWLPEEVLMPAVLVFFAPVHYGSVNNRWVSGQLGKMLDGYLRLLQAWAE